MSMERRWPRRPFAVLGEVLEVRELVAIALVVAASAGATRTGDTVPRDG